MFAYVTIGGLNEVKVFRTDDFSQVATIPVGALPHGLWPSGDGTRIYVGLENGDAVTAIDTLTNKVIGTTAIGQAPQALTYVPDAVPSGDGMQNLSRWASPARRHTSRWRRLAPSRARRPTTVTLFNQGLIQVLEAAVTGLAPKQPYVLALSTKPDGSGPLQPLTAFMTNPAGAAIVNAIGPIRQIVQSNEPSTKQYLVILPGTPDKPGAPAQVQVAS